jgi:hypothetical protein
MSTTTAARSKATVARIVLDAAASTMLIISILLDVGTFVLISALTFDDTVDERATFFWQVFFTALCVWNVVWFVVFTLAARRRWCACHYNSYRMYVGAGLSSSALLTAFVWYDDALQVVVVFIPLVLLRFVFIVDVVLTWFWWTARPLSVCGDALGMTLLKSGWLFWHHTLQSKAPLDAIAPEDETTTPT